MKKSDITNRRSELRGMLYVIRCAVNVFQATLRNAALDNIISNTELVLFRDTLLKMNEENLKIEEMLARDKVE